MPRVKSTGEYPPDWEDIALAVKTDAGWRCERCGHVHDPASGHTLTVHHLDGDKSNCERWNLAALCQKCHLVCQGRVFLPQFFMFEHSDWFKPHVEGYYKSLGLTFQYKGGVLLITGEVSRDNRNENEESNVSGILEDKL